MTRDEALQCAIADACLNEAAGGAIAADLCGFLAARGVSSDDIEAVMAAPHRLAVYRSLVRNGISAVIGRILRRTRARMNAVCGGRFDADLARFMEERGPRTRYLRDVPDELVAWASPRWKEDPAVLSYLPDLARYELTCFAVASCEMALDSLVREVALGRPLVFSTSTRLLRAEWAVHELEVEADSLDVPDARPVALLAYRDLQHSVRWLELTPMAAAIVDRLAAGESIGVAIAHACAATGASVAPDEIAHLLADLADRGVILGAG
jgi:uncharacterized protein